MAVIVGHRVKSLLLLLLLVRVVDGGDIHDIEENFDCMTCIITATNTQCPGVTVK
jgi:hypothetical protein